MNTLLSSSVAERILFRCAQGYAVVDWLPEIEMLVCDCTYTAPAMNERFHRFTAKQIEGLRAQGVDIGGPEDMLKSHEALARPVEPLVEDLARGVRFEQDTHYLTEDGHFTNRYRIVLERPTERARFAITTRDAPTHIQRSLMNDVSVVATINGGFFFLVDEPPRETPKETSFGTVIRSGVLYGVQSRDRPVLWVDPEGEIHVTEVAARGTVTIGERTWSWAGRHSHEATAPLQLFGTDSCVIEHVRDPETGTKRVLNEEESTTPQKDGVTDVVCREHGGVLTVVDIREGGGTSVLAGNVVLQGETSLLQGVAVDAGVSLAYDDLNVEDAHSAITIGPSVSHFQHDTDHPINHDRSLGSNPPFTDRRMARSVVYRTTDGDVVCEVFDGAPKTQMFTGVTPREVGDILGQETADIEWAYFLDSGQSARLAVRHADGTVEGFGNRHYVRWPKKPGHPYLLAGAHGRPVGSCVSAKVSRDE